MKSEIVVEDNIIIMQNSGAIDWHIFITSSQRVLEALDDCEYCGLIIDNSQLQFVTLGQGVPQVVEDFRRFNAHPNFCGCIALVSPRRATNLIAIMLRRLVPGMRIEAFTSQALAKDWFRSHCLSPPPT